MTGQIRQGDVLLVPVGTQPPSGLTPVPDAVAGYLQAVEVTCPTTGRVYHLGVQPTVSTCQAAVASTFGLSGSAYQPVRET